jgi:excisionase family DNA binding protein
MSEEFLLTPDEVCALLAISRSHLAVMITREEIPSIKLGKLRRFPRAALDVWLQERLYTSAQPHPVTDTVTDTAAPQKPPRARKAKEPVTDTVPDAEAPARPAPNTQRRKRLPVTY